MASKIRKKDKVIVLSGKDKGKEGEVVKMLTANNRAIVSSVNIATKHEKPTSQSKGGIKKKELSIHISNLALVDPKDGKPTKVGFRFLPDGTKVRFAKRSGEDIKNGDK